MNRPTSLTPLYRGFPFMGGTHQVTQKKEKDICPETYAWARAGLPQSEWYDRKTFSFVCYETKEGMYRDNSFVVLKIGVNFRSDLLLVRTDTDN